MSIKFNPFPRIKISTINKKQVVVAAPLKAVFLNRGVTPDKKNSYLLPSGAIKASSSMARYLALSFLAFVLTTRSFTQVEAGFTADITGGCSPISVAFTNTSVAGESASFLWDFGNGSTSTARHPRTTYVHPGQYTVTLTVTYQEAVETITRENFIHVYQNPQVSFILTTDSIGCAPFISTFQNLSSNPDNTPLLYTWSFGDGSRSDALHPQHVYTIGGEFNVTLVGVNQHGCIGSFTYPGNITVIKPEALFGVDRNFSCEGSMIVNFTNVSRARHGFVSRWEFGDGSTSHDRSPAHFYSQPGNYSVRLTITDDLGCTGTVLRENLASVIKTTAGFTVSADTICQGQEVWFTNTSRDATSYSWKFPDGTTSQAINTSKRFDTTGDHAILLIAKNGNCSDTIMKRVHVENVVAAFEVSQSFICQLPATVTYTSHSINAATFDWRFGDGTRSIEPSPTVAISQDIPGAGRHNITFTDTLIVTSRHGCKSTYIKQGSVRVVLPRVLIDPGAGGNRARLSGCVPMNLTFHNRTVYDTNEDHIVDTRWRVGQGSLQTGQSIPVTITQPGLIPVALYVTTAKGCVHAAAEIINAGQSLPVDFERVGNYQTCASSPVAFRITSPARSSITREVWDFGDGYIPQLQMPLHHYTRTGQMNVALTIYNLGCASRVVKNNIVNILGPIASFTPEMHCNNPFNYTFRSTLIDAVSWTWDFGDGSPLVHDVPNPTHRYRQTGDFTVRLTARNPSTGCQYTYTRDVHVRQLEAAFDISGAPPCLGNTLTLDGSRSRDAAPFIHQGQTIRYLWLFEEENRTIGSMEAINHQFNRAGVNTISLITRDSNGCLDTARTVITINHPRPDFMASHELGCMPVTFGFEDKTVSGQPIVNWVWSFGDGATSSQQNPFHVYNSFGSFDVSLEVTDAAGCKNRITKNQHVKAVFPDAGFSADKRNLCKGDYTRFFATSQSEIASYHWEFGNGQSSTLATPRVEFPEAGYFDATLTIIDSHGCTATRTLNRFIHVQEPPVADFVADVTESNCYPLVVQFFDRSQTNYPGSWEWHFGENDNLSHLQNPFFIYNRPGRHDVTLISRTSHGCADTIVKPGYIYVGGPFATFAVPDTVCLNGDIWFEPENLINVHDSRWDFGDGHFSFEHSATHRYTRAGNVNPVLFLRSDAMNTCNKAIVDTLNVLDLRARFTITDNSQSGCVPWRVTLKNESLNATSFKWDFGNSQTSSEVNPAPMFETPGNYQITLVAMHPLGCKDSVTASNIVIHPLPGISVSRDTIICLGGTAVLEASGAVTYEWTPNERILNPNLANASASPLETTWFVVRGTDRHGCVNYNGTLVTVQQKPTVTLRDTTLIIGETLRLDISDPSIASYTWYPDSLISCTNCPDPLFTAMESTSYTVTVTDTSNCFSVPFPFNLTVRKKFSVDVPQAFTPNNDDINDVIFVKGWGIKELILFRVFNRFGQVIFESTDINHGWDGTFNGKPQPVETYTYIARVRTHEDTILETRGTIKLLR